MVVPTASVSVLALEIAYQCCHCTPLAVEHLLGSEEGGGQRGLGVLGKLTIAVLLFSHSQSQSLPPAGPQDPSPTLQPVFVSSTLSPVVGLEGGHDSPSGG
ncbi:unnamed protein product, partial [Discosporangium mesarthrocarpum]